nr:MFS transporter [Streptomyces sp. SID4948]
MLGALADGAMLPFVIVWARQVGGLSGTTAGLLFLAQAVGELAGGLLGGLLADRFGHRRTLLVSTVGMALGYGSLFAVHHALFAVAAFLVAGLFESAFHPTIAALIGDLEHDDLHQAFSQARVAANVGRVAGPLIGAAAVTISLSAVFAASGGMLVAASAAVVLTIPGTLTAPENPPAEAELSAVPVAPRAVLRDQRLGLLIAGGGLLSITFTWWEADGLVLLRRQHPLSGGAYAALFAIAAAASIVFQIPASRWARRQNTGRLLWLGAGAQCVGLLALAAGGYGYPVLVGAVLAIAAGQMLYSPTVSTFVTRHATPGRRATYQAALSTTEDIGSAVGPTTGLALGTLASPSLIWLLAAPVCLAAGAVSARAVRTPQPVTG